MLSIEENKEKTKGNSTKRRKFQKPISYKAYVDANGQNCYEIHNKYEKVNPLDLLNEFYSVENSEAETAEAEVLGEKMLPAISLGKRGFASKSKHEDLQRQKGKYLDPKTGAYYNTIEEFRMIRALSAQDKLEKLATQKSVLKSLFMAKKKKLNYFHHELKNN